MDSLRSFLWLWAGITIAIFVYAYVDLQLHPALMQERPMTLVPDWEQAPNLIHWGGRLVREGAFSLLIGNAILLGGLLTLVAEAVMRLVRRALKAGGGVSQAGAGAPQGSEGA